ncbi:LysR family transcriptional regulator [Pseudomonas oryzihabitans]|nr:LysR family transcriptional regulator [Pseudomonas psychrotolerans]
MLPTEGLPEPKLLMLFEVLYSTGSVTRAAEQLGQSQPTISLWLGKLRQQLRDPLFVRTPGGMKPTPQAEALITPCREVLESLRRLVAWEVAFDPATAQRLFRLCLSDASHITLLPRILAHLREVAPGVRLEIARIDGNTEQALEIGEADLAVGFIPWLGGGIYQQVLFPQDWVCLVSAEHPRLQNGFTAAAYAQEGHVLVSAGTGQKLLEAALVRAEVQRRIVLELPGFLGVGAVVGNSDLIVTLPRHIGTTLATTYGLKLHKCPVPIEAFAVKQHWHARYHQDAGNRWLRGVFVELFGRSR